MTQVEVTQAEIELLFEALEAWEESPQQKGFSNAMMSAMLTKDQAQREQILDKTLSDSKQEGLRRKRRSIMLKAKLIQSLEQGSTDSLFNTAVSLPRPKGE